MSTTDPAYAPDGSHWPDPEDMARYRWDDDMDPGPDPQPGDDTGTQ